MCWIIQNFIGVTGILTLALSFANQFGWSGTGLVVRRHQRHHLQHRPFISGIRTWWRLHGGDTFPKSSLAFEKLLIPKECCCEALRINTAGEPTDISYNELFSPTLFNLFLLHVSLLISSDIVIVTFHLHDTPPSSNMCLYIAHTCCGVRPPKRRGERNRRCGRVLKEGRELCDEALRRKSQRPCAATRQNSSTVADMICRECKARASGEYDSGMESGSSSSSGFSTSSNGSVSYATWRR